MTMKQAPAPKPGAAFGAPGKPHIKQKKPKKPMPRFLVAVLTALIFLLLLGGAGACLWFNVGGIADQAAALFPQYRAAMSTLDQRKAALQASEQKLAADRDALAVREEAVLRDEAGLKSREDKLKADEAALAARLAEEKTDQERNQVTIGIYTAMEATVAATMLDRANTLQEAAAILRLLPTDTVAGILAEMDPKKAFELTKLLRQ